jgi:hypothetical protein
VHDGEIRHHYAIRGGSMPDERQDSIRQGIGAPEESEAGKAAAEERRRRAADGAPIGGGLGGTSDTDSPGEEADFKRRLVTRDDSAADRGNDSDVGES